MPVVLAALKGRVEVHDRTKEEENIITCCAQLRLFLRLIKKRLLFLEESYDINLKDASSAIV